MLRGNVRDVVPDLTLPELVLSRRHELGESLVGLAKLVEALKAYLAGQRLVVFAIVVLFVAASLFGVAALQMCSRIPPLQH